MRSGLAKPDRIMMKIPAGTYKNQSNNDKDVVVDGFRHQLAVRKNMSADQVYKITKTLFDNLPDMKKAAAFFMSGRLSKSVFVIL